MANSWLFLGNAFLDITLFVSLVTDELSRVRGLLTQSARSLKEKAAENAQMEADVLMAKSKLMGELKQVLSHDQLPGQDLAELNKAQEAHLQAELAHIEQVIDDLHLRRKEINAAIEGIRQNDSRKKEIVRASPTGLAGSAPLPGKKKISNTYMETDLDSMETRDLASVHFKNSGSEGEDTPLYENVESATFNGNDILCQFQVDEDLLGLDPNHIYIKLGHYCPLFTFCAIFIAFLIAF